MEHPGGALGHLRERVDVSDVALDDLHALGEVTEILGPRRRVERDDVRTLADEALDDERADEARPARDEKSLSRKVHDGRSYGSVPSAR